MFSVPQATLFSGDLQPGISEYIKTDFDFDEPMKHIPELSSFLSCSSVTADSAVKSFQGKNIDNTNQEDHISHFNFKVMDTASSPAVQVLTRLLHFLSIYLLFQALFNFAFFQNYLFLNLTNLELIIHLKHFLFFYYIIFTLLFIIIIYVNF